MVLHLSGKFTSMDVDLFWSEWVLMLEYDSDWTKLVLLSSTLGGSHGVPSVHYKGRVGDYYIMVCVVKLCFFPFNV